MIGLMFMKQMQRGESERITVGFGLRYFKINNSKFVKNNLEITISISDPSTSILHQETKQEYFNRLLKAKENLDNSQNVITYKADK